MDLMLRTVLEASLRAFCVASSQLLSDCDSSSMTLITPMSAPPFRPVGLWPNCRDPGRQLIGDGARLLSGYCRPGTVSCSPDSADRHTPRNQSAHCHGTGR